MDHTTNNLGSNSVQQQPAVGDANYQRFVQQFAQRFVQNLDTLVRNYSPPTGQFPLTNLLIPMMPPPFQFPEPLTSQFMNLLLQAVGNMNYNDLVNVFNLLGPNPLFGGPPLLNQPQVDQFTNLPNAGMNHSMVRPMDVPSNGQMSSNNGPNSSSNLSLISLLNSVSQHYNGRNQPQMMMGEDATFAGEFELAPPSDEEDSGLTAERIRRFEHFNAKKSLVGERCCICMKDLKVR